MRIIWITVICAICVAIVPFKIHAASEAANWNSVFQDFVKLVKQIWVRITAAARIFDTWLQDHIHISFSKIIRFIANIIIWVLESIIHAIKWILTAIA